MAATDEEVEKLARRMWGAYVRSAKGRGEFSDEYAPWEELDARDPDTSKGFRGVARMVLRDYVPRKLFQGVARTILKDYVPKKGRRRSV